MVIFFAILFYTGVQSHLQFDKQGLLVGLAMAVRMIVLVVGFSAIGIELRNPLVRAVLYRKGMGNLYKSLGLSFSVLPAIIEQNANPKHFLKNPVEVIAKMVVSAEKIFEKFQNHDEIRQAVIITGQKTKGKTSFLLKINEILKQNNVKVGGFVAEGVWIDNQRSGFILYDIENQKEIQLATTDKKTDLKVGRFYFNKQAFLYGNRLIIRQLDRLNIFFIDEVGYLELNNGGWSKIIEKIFEQKKLQVWTVRQSLVKEAIRRFGITKAYIFDIEKDTPSDAAEFLSFYTQSLH
jgi:nucleoside-triphosphatase THEP1